MAEVTVYQDGIPHRLSFCPPMNLENALEQLGLRLPHPCGGLGKCGKCAVTLSGAVSPATVRELSLGYRLSCMTELLGDASVVLPGTAGMEQIQLAQSAQGQSPMEGTYGAAIDIGTTTLALALYDLRSGCLLSQSAAGNPQASIAADVIGRIQAAMNGQGTSLQTMVLNTAEALLADACQKAAVEPAMVDLLVLTGNTTMLYLLTGRNPASLSQAPFQADTLFGAETTILGRRAYLPPCMNAFVGADITCAVLACEICHQKETVLLCDIGTNGELALWHEGTLYVTSTAAGPAFEGAGISCGCGSIRGAIDKAWVESGSLCLHTIGDAPPAGICGSGLIDLVAAGLALERIDDTGAMEESLDLAPGVALTPQDIRAVQLAKAAIAAGIETLLHHAQIVPQDICRVYIAGGFGSHLNTQSAAAIGLIPQALANKVTAVGNSALLGAGQLLLNHDLPQQAEAIASASIHVNLGGNPRFNESYMENMLFPQ